MILKSRCHDRGLRTDCFGMGYLSFSLLCVATGPRPITTTEVRDEEKVNDPETNEVTNGLGVDLKGQVTRAKLSTKRNLKGEPRYVTRDTTRTTKSET